ncbi:MAG: AAA family ATPase [Pseudomonadales bacterium]
MWIRRLEVANWRGLDFAIEDLDPGLNLIAGPNESGKSRLVEALRFALFESTSGRASHKKNLESWGVAPEKPQVSVTFELRGTSWQLEKVFLGSGCNTRLRGGSEDLSGEDAERRLSDLLGVAGGSGRTEIKLRDQGIWSLLWVDQGNSGLEPVHNDDAQNRILGLLTDEIGEVAAGESGKRLLDRARIERDRYYTSDRGNEREPLTRARQTVQELEVRLTEATARRAALAQTADDLERARHKVAELQRRHAEAQAELQSLRTRHEQTLSLQRELSIAEERVGSARQSRDEAERQLESLSREHEALEALAATIEKRTQDLEQIRSDSAQAQQAFVAAKEEHDALQQRIGAHEQRVRALRRLEKLTAQRNELEQTSKRLQEVRGLVDRAAQVRAELARLPSISATDVNRLRQAQEAHNDARARLQGAAVTVEVTARRDLDLEGSPLAAGATRRFTIDDDRELNLDDTATVHVRPGAGEILTLREAARDAERELRRLLAELGTADIDAAERTARQREALALDLERHQTAVVQLAPAGLPALEQREAELRAGVAAASAELADAEPLAADALRSTEAELDALNAAAMDSQARRTAAQQRLSEAQVAFATSTSRLDGERDEHRRRARALAEQPALEELRANLTRAEESFRERFAARDAIKARFDASGGTTLDEDLQRATKAEAQLREQISGQQEARIRLEASLLAGSGDARHEQVLDLEAELTQARAALARVERQAAAARRLYEVLDREYRAARDRLSRPVIERIRPYLDSVFPGSEVWLDEELALKGLRTASGQEQFEFLSGGAREQLALLVRIGLAEVIGSVEPWPLVLDDVLVNTDAERIRRMQRALYSAGRRMQILLFTCHGALFDGLGPDRYIELPAPRTRAAVAIEEA